MNFEHYGDLYLNLFLYLILTMKSTCYIGITNSTKTKKLSFALSRGRVRLVFMCNYKNEYIVLYLWYKGDKNRKWQKFLAERVDIRVAVFHKH